MKRTIVLTGGGTLGPVTPLLAVAKEWQEHEPGVHIVWIGTPNGPERAVVERYGYAFYALNAPKLSRHKQWTWPFIPFQLMTSCLQARTLLNELKPDMVFTAGGYTSVPVVWMAKLMKIPSWVHQLDVMPGLANKLMAPAANRVSVTWDESAEGFGAEKTLVVGGMVRPEIFHGDRERFLRDNKLDPEKMTVIVLGGGTGAQAINEAMDVIVDDLLRDVNVVHVTGKGKLDEAQEVPEGYVHAEFFNEDMKDAFAAADVVVSRAGMGTMLELIALQKPSVLIPIPGSHQEANARMALERGISSVISHLTPQMLQQEIRKLTSDTSLRRQMAGNARKAIAMEAEKRIVRKARELL